MSHPESSEHPRTEWRTRASRRSTFAAITTWIVIVSALLAIATPAMRSFVFKGRMADNLCRARQLDLSLRNYASEQSSGGRFPTFKDRETNAELLETSSEAFQLLVPRYLDDKGPFFNKSSAWCYRRVRGGKFEHQIYPGENDWVYMRGLTENSNSRYPILANACAPGTTTYVADPARPGGVWKGANAIVVYAGGSAEQVETGKTGDAYFIKRVDKPESNALEIDESWLSEPNVKLLYPELPNPKILPAEAVLSVGDGC